MVHSIEIPHPHPSVVRSHSTCCALGMRTCHASYSWRRSTFESVRLHVVLLKWPRFLFSHKYLHCRRLSFYNFFFFLPVLSCVVHFFILNTVFVFIHSDSFICVKREITERRVRRWTLGRRFYPLVCPRLSRLKGRHVKHHFNFELTGWVGRDLGASSSNNRKAPLQWRSRPGPQRPNLLFRSHHVWRGPRVLC